MPSTSSRSTSGTLKLLISVSILSIPRFTDGRISFGGGGVRQPEPVALPIPPPAVTDATATATTTSSSGVRLVATQGLQGSQSSKGSQASQGSKWSTGSQRSQGSPIAHGSQGVQAFERPQGTQGSQGLERFQRSKGSNGIQLPQGLRGPQVSEGGAEAASTSATIVETIVVTTEALTMAATLASGSMALSTDTGDIGAGSRPLATSKRGGPWSRCSGGQSSRLGQGRSAGEQTDGCRDGPMPDEDDATLLEPSTELAKLCDNQGKSADYWERLSGTGALMKRNAGTSTGCPNHVNWNINPYPSRHTPSITAMPAYPRFMADGGTTILNEAAGAVGIMLNGVSQFSSWAQGRTGSNKTSEAADMYNNSAFFAEADSIDICGGVSTSEGWYHYSSAAGCLQEQAMVVAETRDGAHTPLLGWAFDGFPIYGQLGPDGVEMKVCGQRGADATHCLDSCSGYEADLPEIDSFKYRYYTSCGFNESFFPFTTNCFRGCCPDGMECHSRVESCDSEVPEPGYREDYMPAAADPLDQVYESVLLEGFDSAYIDSHHSVDCGLYLGSDDNTYSPSPAPTGFTFSPSRVLPTDSWSTMATTAPTASPSGMHTASPTGSYENTYWASPAPTRFAPGPRGSLSMESWSAMTTTAPTASLSEIYDALLTDVAGEC